MVSVSVITTAANTASHPPPTYTYTCALSSWSLLAYCADPLLWVDKAMAGRITTTTTTIKLTDGRTDGLTELA